MVRIGRFLLLCGLALVADAQETKTSMIPVLPLASPLDSTANVSIISQDSADASDTTEPSDTADDEDTDTDGWQQWTASLGISLQQQNLKSSGSDTLQRGSNIILGREWTSGDWTVGPQIGLDGSREQLPTRDSGSVAANMSLGLSWSPNWFSASLTGFYIAQNGPHDLGATGSMKATWDLNDFLFLQFGVNSTASRLQHVSAFLEPRAGFVSSWFDAFVKADLGGQWEAYSRLHDSIWTTTGPKGLTTNHFLQIVSTDSGLVPMLQTSASFAFHGKSWSVGPYWKFQAWNKNSSDTTKLGKTTRLEQHQYNNDLGLDGSVQPSSWLGLDLDVSHGTQTGTSLLNGHVLTEHSNPRLAARYPWLKTAALPTGWNLALTATTHW